MTATAVLHPLDALRLRGDWYKGFVFERLAEGYLKAVYGATDFKPQYPDYGIDRFFTHRDGRRFASQMKCWAPHRRVSTGEVAFFVEAARVEGITNMVYLTTSGLTAPAARYAREHGVTVHYYDDLTVVPCWDWVDY